MDTFEALRIQFYDRLEFGYRCLYNLEKYPSLTYDTRFLARLSMTRSGYLWNADWLRMAIRLSTCSSSVVAYGLAMSSWNVIRLLTSKQMNCRDCCRTLGNVLICRNYCIYYYIIHYNNCTDCKVAARVLYSIKMAFKMFRGLCSPDPIFVNTSLDIFVHKFINFVHGYNT